MLPYSVLAVDGQKNRGSCLRAESVQFPEYLRVSSGRAGFHMQAGLYPKVGLPVQEDFPAKTGSPARGDLQSRADHHFQVCLPEDFLQHGVYSGTA